MSFPICPVSDPRLAADLVAAGLPLDDVSALLVFPAVYVAWADGTVSARETKAVWSAARAAQVQTPAALGRIDAWLRKRPRDPEGLLDLCWRVYECVPALYQRCSPELAFSMASMTARYDSGLFRLFRIGAKEREALETLEGYFAGRGLETPRREALRWGFAQEREVPGLTLVPWAALSETQGEPLSSALVRALHTIESAPDMARFATRAELSPDELARLRKVGVKERARRLLPPVKEAFQSLDPEERELVGGPASLGELEPWQAARLALLIVCRACRGYPDTLSVEELQEVYDSQDEARIHAVLERHAREVQELLAHDLAPTPALLRALLLPAQLEVVCRHYVRMVCAAYQGLKRAAPGLADTFLIPLYGTHDVLVRQGHAWCLFVDARRGVACALDPTAADATWDAGNATSFLNGRLCASTYANASGLLARLLTAKGELGPDAAVALAEASPDPARFAVRALLQPAVHANLSEAELDGLLGQASALGAPTELLERVREGHAPLPPELFDAGHHTATRRNLARLFAAAGLAADGL
ncbi:MAG: hypothetical protein R3F62_00680 [Planctomycetota bacterium]